MRRARAWPRSPASTPAAGLRYLRGRLPTYLRLLRTLATNHAEEVARLQARLAAGDAGAARAVAHSLKSMAGTLGAVRVQALAAELECLLADPTSIERAKPLCEATRRELADLSSAILERLR